MIAFVQVCYNSAMKNMMAIIILAVIYSLYVLLGIYKQFPVGYIDWNSPFAHYTTLAAKETMQALALPCVIFALAGLSWYKRSMIGEP